MSGDPAYVQGMRLLAVVDGQPISCIGVRRVCEDAGFTVADVDDPALRDELCALVVVVHVEDDARLVGGWAERVACPIVALVPNLSPRCVKRVLSFGASSVIGCCATPEELLATLDSAIAGRTVLPSAVIRELAADAGQRESVTPQERAWLKALATGATVCELACQSCYSERQLYRRLQALYQRLGARRRTDALLLAERAGLLGD